MSTCRWVASDQPRIVRGRHGDNCPGHYDPEQGERIIGCDGCQPCTEPHCRVCGVTHADGSCAECLAEAREYLREIGRMCDALPEEVKHRGIEGEAMMLLGPTADAEARGHAEASYLAGRLPEGWLETGRHGKKCPILRNEPCLGCGAGESHPLTVLGTWQDVYATEFDHEITRRATIEDAVGYLDRNLSYAADWPHVPFEDFARDLRRCASHLESVLHDGEQRDEGAPCMTCEKPLRRVWGADERGDGWECPRCRQRSTEDQYRFAVMHLHREEAEWLTDRDMEIRTGVKAGTVRVWANRDLVKRKRDSGRTLYLVADVTEQAETRGLVS